MHDLRDQTRFAAQKFNCCSVRGWVMPVLIPKDTNPEQVVWCLVWHTLKCVMPPMPLLLPADFSYCNDTQKVHMKVGACWHVHNSRESPQELRESVQYERQEATRLYQTLLAMTGLPHDYSCVNLRKLQRLMFVGELVAHGTNQGKASTYEAAEFVRRYGVQDYHALADYQKKDLQMAFTNASVMTSVLIELIANRKTVLGAHHADHEKMGMTEEELVQAHAVLDAKRLTMVNRTVVSWVHDTAYPNTSETPASSGPSSRRQRLPRSSWAKN
jgi:hypothetical protein